MNALCVYDENRLISGSDDCTLRVWKVSPGDCLRVIRHESSVTTVLCLSDGQIFCASLDQKLRRARPWLHLANPPARGAEMRREGSLSHSSCARLTFASYCALTCLFFPRVPTPVWDDSLSCQCDVGSPLGGTVLCSVIVGTRRESLKERVSLTESACP